MHTPVYMDNAATTPICPEAADAMRPYLKAYFGNPSGVYDLSVQSRRAIEQARAAIAQTLSVPDETIYFTAGGTESDNWALIGAAQSHVKKGWHLITTSIEHHAVLNTCAYLEKLGWEVTYLPVDEKGFIDPAAVEAAIRPQTVLISVMAANNEIGTLEPLEAVGRIAGKYGILFHTDAVQAYGHLPIDADLCGLDMLSASAHKFNGPKGTGFLYVRERSAVTPLIHGGGQEYGMRAGTENVAGIVGMGAAAQAAAQKMETRARTERRLRDRLIGRICSELPYVRLNGDRKHRLPNNASFCFPGVDSVSLLVMLDMAGISASGGSACASGSGMPSHVLTAVGCTKQEAQGALRLTLSAENTEDDIDYTVMHVKRIVNELRCASV